MAARDCAIITFVFGGKLYRRPAKNSKPKKPHGARGIWARRRKLFSTTTLALQCLERIGAATCGERVYRERRFDLLLGYEQALDVLAQRDAQAAASPVSRTCGDAERRCAARAVQSSFRLLGRPTPSSSMMACSSWSLHVSAMVACCACAWRAMFEWNVLGTHFEIDAQPGEELPQFVVDFARNALAFLRDDQFLHQFAALLVQCGELALRTRAFAPRVPNPEKDEEDCQNRRRLEKFEGGCLGYHLQCRHAMH